MTLTRRIGSAHGLIWAAVFALVVLSTAGARADVRIGIAAPLSGSDAIFGSQIRTGVEQAVSDINAAGGVLGERLDAVPGDDSGDPKRGVSVADGFVRDKIRWVVGPFSSSVTLAASEVYAKAGVLAITPSASAPAITDRNLSTIFRLCGRDDSQAAVATHYLLGHHVAKVAILHDRTSAAKALADAVRKGLNAAGVRDVLYASIDKGDKDVGPLAARIKASGAQVAFWGGAQVEAALLARQLHATGARVTLMGGVAMASDDFGTLADGGADGTLLVFPEDPRRRPQAAALLRRLRQKGSEPDAYTFYAYAAVQVLQQAAKAAKSLDPAALAAVMHSGKPFDTVLGPIAFDAKGDVTPPDDTVHVWHRNAAGRMTFHDDL